MVLSGRNEAGAEWMSPGGGNGLGAVLTPDRLFMRQRGMPPLAERSIVSRHFEADYKCYHTAYAE